MRLDAVNLSFLGREDFRVLSALEVASRNHRSVPLTMLASLCKFDVGVVDAVCKTLIRFRLIRKNVNGFELGFGGGDYLALHVFSQRGGLRGVGTRIGVGKESDIHEAQDSFGNILVLKLHRLGRTSFRRVKATRDYLGHRLSASWLYLSRLAAQKEFAFLKVYIGYIFTLFHFWIFYIIQFALFHIGSF